MLDTLLQQLANNGVVATVLGIMLWFNYKLVQKLFEVIKANTEVMVNSTKTQEAGILVIQKNTDVIAASQVNEQSHREESKRTHNELHLVKAIVTDLDNGVEQILKAVKG